MFSRKNSIYGIIRGKRYRKVLDRYSELNRNQWLPSDKIAELSWQKTKKTILYSYKNVEYYHSLFKGAGLHPSDIKDPIDMLKIPITTKQDIKRNYPHKIISRKVGKTDWHPHSTSGSTGEPFEFAVDHNLNIGRSARDLLAYEWALKHKRDKIVFITGAREKNSITRLINRYLRRRLIISAFEIHSTKDLEDYIEKIERFHPNSIMGYVSSLTVMAQYLANHDRSLGGSIRSVIPAGETVSESYKRLLEERIGPVFRRYGCREFGSIAGECDHHQGHHVHAESFFIEIIKNGENADYREKGEIILTNTENLALPFVRYSMGDISTLIENRCSCGRGLPLLGDIEGRIVSLVKTPKGKLISVHYLTLLFEDYGKYFTQFQAIQKTPNYMELLIVPTRNVDQKVVDFIHTQLQDYVGDDFEIEIRQVDSIPLGPTGKRELVRSEL
ncbi:MAG: phenylacetate--CoA ligase family protein [Candidatus Heimdallarchaeota archaeon]